MTEFGLPAVLSYAGRVANPRPQPVPVRIGGFGGAMGMAAWLLAEDIGQIIDATHPFAAQISANAVQAAACAGLPICAFERAPWAAQPQDRWQSVADIAAAAAALQGPAARVFLAIGRLHLAAFADLNQHDILLRVVDPPAADFPLPHAQIEVARGPFDLAGDLALMRAHGTEILVAKNAGGSGAQAKIDAARALGLRIIMIERPLVPERTVFTQMDQVLDWLHSRLGV